MRGTLNVSEMSDKELQEKAVDAAAKLLSLVLNPKNAKATLAIASMHQKLGHLLKDVNTIVDVVNERKCGSFIAMCPVGQGQEIGGRQLYIYVSLSDKAPDNIDGGITVIGMPDTAEIIPEVLFTDDNKDGK